MCGGVRGLGRYMSVSEKPVVLERLERAGNRASSAVKSLKMSLNGSNKKKSFSSHLFVFVYFLLLC